ncbi:MAG: flagellin [Chloroflexi bacterium]|nr:flagellin [Chloroflexota bacterium]
MAAVDVTRIASNIGALNALNSLNNINAKLAMHQTRLSTGKRINSAADDPAGLTIATKMLARSEGMKVALDNIGDASNMLAVTESGLSKMNDILVIMRNKAEQAASDTLGSSERDAIATQLSAFAEQIDSMVSETKWNSTALLDGTVNKRFQTGVDDGEYTTFTMTSKFDPTTLGISTNVAADTAVLASGSTTVGTTTVNSGFSKLSTGTYNVTISAAAASATTGKVTELTSLPGLSIAAVVGTATASEWTSGQKDITLVSYTAAGNILTYKIGTGSNAVMTVADGASVTDTTFGVSLFATGATDATSTDALWTALVPSAQNISLDYVAQNKVKFAVTNGSGEAVAIDSDGINTSPNASANTAYASFGQAYNTGKGVTLGFAAAPAAGTSTFSFAAKNNYSVDVSSASKASTYMTTVNTAMNTVNASLAGLGSLMARLSYKAEQVANAQVNIEGSYSRIMNANMAEEQMNASKYTILQQVAVSMLAQANQAPQSLLALFR